MSGSIGSVLSPAIPAVVLCASDQKGHRWTGADWWLTFDASANVHKEAAGVNSYLKIKWVEIEDGLCALEIQKNSNGHARFIFYHRFIRGVTLGSPFIPPASTLTLPKPR